MRLFFGLSLPQEVRPITDACALEAQRIIPGRYALSENHHITLAFLGEVSEQQLPQAYAVLAHCTKDFPAPRITLDGFSHFGKAQNGILILRVKYEPALDTLHSRLITALREEGLPFDPGPFSPHITLARHAQVPNSLPDCPASSFTAAHAHVFLSARDDKNILRYTPLHTVPFLNGSL